VKSDSFEELEVGRDIVMPSPPLYYLLPRPHYGSITASTPKQWSDFLFPKLQAFSFDLWIYLSSKPTKYAERNGLPFYPVHIKECGVHVVVGKLDSFEESEVGKDTVMPSPPLYHLLSHSHCGSITASTPKQWSDFLFAKLQGHSLDLTLDCKNKYFI
jgi:hypothetical protein